MCLCGLSLEAAPLKDTLRREVVAIPYKKGGDPLLNDLWRSYRRTKRDSKKEAILKQIRLFAISKGLPDQVFEADFDLYKLTRNKNYKLRSTEFVETLMDLEENADRFYSVLFVEYFNYDNESVSLKSYLLDNRDELSRTSHKSYLEAVRPSDWFYLSYPRELISNDYEYFLWRYTRGNSGIGELLEDYVKGKYPQEDYIRCRMADKDQLLDFGGYRFLCVRTRLVFDDIQYVLLLDIRRRQGTPHSLISAIALSIHSCSSSLLICSSMFRKVPQGALRFFLALLKLVL